MKLSNTSPAFLAVLALGTVAFLGGCSSTGVDRSTSTSNSIKDVDAEIRKVIVQLDITGVSLDALVKDGNPDLRKSFDTYSANLAKLDAEGQRMIKRSDEMKSHSKEYFEEWEKQGDAFVNPTIRELTEERRVTLANLYAQVPAASTGVRGSYLDCMTDMKEIQKHLSNDLTPKGVASVADVARQCVKNREALQASFLPVLVALDGIKAELYSGKK